MELLKKNGLYEAVEALERQLQKTVAEMIANGKGKGKVGLTIDIESHMNPVLHPDTGEVITYADLYFRHKVLSRIDSKREEKGQTTKPLCLCIAGDGIHEYESGQIEFEEV